MSHVDDCAKFIECLSAYFDGELEAEVEEEFRLHLESCERARTMVRTFERTIILHRRTGEVPLTAAMHERLLAVIKACQNESDE